MRVAACASALVQVAALTLARGAAGGGDGG